jgi:outer membrane cobalamin receptor
VVLRNAFLFSLVTFFFLPYTLAEEVHTFNLGEIVISNDATTPESPSTAEVTTHDITASNAQTVDEALDFISGVRVTVGQKNEPEVNIRGFGQDKVLVLWDGIPLASPYYRFVDLDQIPVESIAKIKVIKTPTSVLYGANTMGGIINIVSKEPGAEPHLEASGNGSFYGEQYATAAFSVASESLSFWFSGGHRESEGFRLSKNFDSGPNEDGDIRDNSFYEKNSISLKVGAKKDDQHRISAFVNYIDNEKGIPPHSASNRPRYWQFPEWRRLLVGITGESAITDTVSIKGRAYYDKYDNTLKSFDDGTYTTQAQPSSWTSIFDEYAAGAGSYLYVNAIEGHALAGVVNFRRDSHREQDDTGNPWEKYVVHTYSFGVQDDVTLGENISLSAGVSYDIFDQRRMFTAQKGDSVDAINPLLSVRYTVTPEMLLYSTVSRRTQFPTLNQLYARTSGNPDLDEQKNTNVEAGIQYKHNELATVDVTYFYNRAKDLIDRASRNDPYLNISKAVFQGIEANMQTEIGNHASGRVSYTYLHARDKEPSLFGRSEEELPYLPEHKADVELGYHFDKGPSWYLMGSYHGKRYYYGGDGRQHDMGGYFVWNTRLSHQFLTHWEGSVAVENILDRNYQEEEGFPQPGRAIYLGIKGVF